MKRYVTFVAGFAAVVLAGCRTQTALVDYSQIQKIALASISEKYPSISSSEMHLDSIKSEMAANGSEVIEVDYKDPSSTKREKDSARYGQKTMITVTTVFVRMSNSGKIQEVGEGTSISFE